jgi:YesN/AraC family two-component response regulator
MEKPAILWVDLTHATTGSARVPDVHEFCTVHRIFDVQEISFNIDLLTPAIICFEYDFPDTHGLEALSQTKRDYSAIPILMLTEYHSESLAVWALRARVWDYLVKPITTDELLHPLNALFALRGKNQHDAPRSMVSREQRVPEEAMVRQDKIKQAIAKAQLYIDTHHSKKLTACEVAHICGMSLSHFSRVFKENCGKTFSEYVMETRIQKATVLLKRPYTSVTEVCYDVGFQDTSYFTKIFRRFIGVTPSQYLQQFLPAKTA